MTSKKAGTKKSQPASTTSTMASDPRLVFGLGGCILVTLLLFFLVYQTHQNQQGLSNPAAELRILSTQLAINSQLALQGSSQAFVDLQKNQADFQKYWEEIRNSSPMTAANLDKLQPLWNEVQDKSQQIAAKMPDILQLHKQSATIQAGLLQIKKSYQDLLLLTPVSAGVFRLIVEKQLALTDRMLFTLDAVLGGQKINGQATLFKDGSGFMQDLQSLDRVLREQLQSELSVILGREDLAGATKILNDNLTQVRNLQSATKEFTTLVVSMLQAKQASRSVTTNANTLLQGLNDLPTTIKSDNQAFLFLVMGIGLAAISVAVLIWKFSQSNLQTQALLEAEASIRANEEQANLRNQQAILRLLDELGHLADGDLTVETTVTEDFTGAIADSINFTVDQLRSLVSTINQTAVQVSSAAGDTQHTAKALAEASDHQAQEIAGASAAINEMALSIDQVSANAYESAAVAERSVSIAKKGADVVQATIRGMDTIREQIQDTSKRIKRLGESSQEIGDIVSLINDIADQTNILALNAAIQASMAGDAGRGFAVVADEVQRLAERASAATKQIEALVKTIQNDTHEAVISMEQTTTQVVNGANLAQDAGVALEEIESVSSNLANLIQNISNAARQQAASAGQISNTMNVIQEITSQTSAGTSVTASSIGHLAELAVQMRTSVAGFKLPDQKQRLI